MKKEKLEDYIVSIPDFPEKGIIFRDVTSLLEDPDGLERAINEIYDRVKDLDFDVVGALESRGFLFGTPIAWKMHKSFVPIRKKGKLPRAVISEKYDLEYGTSELEIHKDSIKKGDKVLLIDDLLATGGTLEAACKLVERLGGEVVMISLLMELKGLNGREKLSGYNVDSLISYPGK